MNGVSQFIKKCVDVTGFVRRHVTAHLEYIGEVLRNDCIAAKSHIKCFIIMFSYNSGL